jgi:uncharacterized cofD-like protein
MMEQYSGDFLAAVDGLRALLGCAGSVWPVSVEPASLCAAYSDGSETRGEVEVDNGQVEGRTVDRVWLDPQVGIHPATAAAIRELEVAIIGPGSFYTSLIPIFMVRGAAEALQAVAGPVILVTNLVTEGRGMRGFTAGEAVRRMSEAIGRPVDVVIANTAPPASAEAGARYAAEHKELLALGDVPAGCDVVAGDFWSGDIARHDRRRLAYAVWGVVAQRLFS